MAWLLAADLVVLIHLIWIIFVLFGLPLAWRRPAWVWPHLAAAAGLVVVNLGGWYCPLTHLEVWLRGRADPALAYPGSFVFHYMERLIYPPLPEAWLRGAALAWAGLTLGGHLLMWRGRRRWGAGAEKPCHTKIFE